MEYIRATNIEKEFSDRIILQFDELIIRKGDKIGVVGKNGAGKTTLLNILTGEIVIEKGSVKRHVPVVYLKQFEDLSSADFENIDGKLHSELSVRGTYCNEYSGGESKRLQLANIFAQNGSIFILDEPTCNLDCDGIKVFKEQLTLLDTFLLVCHDQCILDEFCSGIIDVDHGTIKYYTGNYSDYIKQRDEQTKRQLFEHMQYISERERLQKVILEQTIRAIRITRKPIDKGQRIGKEIGTRAKGTQQKSLDRVAKATRARLERLQVTEKPQQDTRIQLDFSLTDPPKNQFVIKIDRLSFQYNDRVIFDTITFFIKNRERVAITGPNGVGKTTLLNLIYGRHPSIQIAPKAKIGYLHQNFSGIHMKKTVLENALHNNVQPITTVRTVLKHLLFSTSDLDKISYVLSGGERLRLGLAMLILAKNNVLLLDEPTNYLDIPSISAMEELLSSYPGTLLFVSHDDHFINTVATENVTISDFQIK